jgi:hypothetical protein
VDDGFRFRGIESVTIELDGTFDATALALPAGFEHDAADARGRVSLFAFHVDGLRVTGVPLLSFTYPELLWRIAVRPGAAEHVGDEHERAWWVIACDLHARGPRWAARRYVRYDVRANHVEVAEHRIASRGPTGELSIGIDNKVEPAPPMDAERVLRVGRDAGWRVPWGDDRGMTNPLSHLISVEADTLSEATLGTKVMWATRAVVRRGRQHRCGVARR